MKTCASCEQAKALTNFSGDPRGVSGVHAYCRDCQKIYAKKYRASPKGRVPGLLHDAARRRPVSITREWLLERLERGVCEATGLPFSFAPMEDGRHQNPFAPSLDRCDPKGDYTPGNTRLVIFAYNTAKGQMQASQAFEVITAMARGMCGHA